MSVFKTKITSVSRNTLVNVEVNYTLHKDAEDIMRVGRVELEDVFLILNSTEVEILLTEKQIDEIWENMGERLDG